MKLFKKKSNSNDDFLAQEAKEEAATAADYTLDIPDDEIWSYQIEGLQAPAIKGNGQKAPRYCGFAYRDFVQHFPQCARRSQR